MIICVCFFVDFDVTCVMRGVLIRDSKSFIHVVRRENSNVVGVVFFMREIVTTRMFFTEPEV